MKSYFYVEIKGEQIDYQKLETEAKEIWKSSGKFVKDIKQLEIYLNTDEKTCYYVINGDFKGSFSL